MQIPFKSVVDLATAKLGLAISLRTRKVEDGVLITLERLTFYDKYQCDKQLLITTYSQEAILDYLDINWRYWYDREQQKFNLKYLRNLRSERNAKKSSKGHSGCVPLQADYRQ